MTHDLLLIATGVAFGAIAARLVFMWWHRRR